jgi:hypothetical protein
MADYRVYLVGTDGNFYDVVPLVCTDDAEAIEHAQRLAVGYDVELWQLVRKIAVFQDQDKNTKMKLFRALLRHYLTEQPWPKAATAKNWSAG